MAIRSGNSNPVIIRNGTRIGHIDAANDDEFLFDCFVDHPALQQVRDVSSSGMILSGRTGSGKTAILRYIERTEPNNSNIELADLAMNYISNSDIFRFLHDIGADLDVFFQTIWKHILCLEYVRMRYRITDESQSKSFIVRLFDRLSGDPKRKRALEYLQKWEGKFWITVDENVKEITKKYETQISAELGVDIQQFRSKAGYGRNLSVDQKSEMIARARKVISGDQLADLGRVLELLSAENENERIRYYILIDKLDDRWVDDSVKFRLIRSLIEALKSFRRIHNLKIIVAIRTDVLERVIQENRDSGFQREKYDDYIVPLRWSEKQLKEFVQKRINLLFRRKYTTHNIHFEDVFPHSVRNQDPFTYLIDRTLLRPRDVLSFINTCLQESENQAEVTASRIFEAEKRYSNLRRIALIDEWKSAYPTLEVLLDFFSGGTESRSFSDIATKEVIESIALPIVANEKIAYDPMHILAEEIWGKNPMGGVLAFSRTMIEILYRVGVIGVKFGPEQRFVYSYKDMETISSPSIGEDSKIKIHKMLHKSLNIDDGYRGSNRRS